MILQDLKKDRENTWARRWIARHHVPAYFNDAQRRPPRRPARSPASRSSASSTSPPPALCYGLDKKKDEKIAVFDLGGGTFDISILDIGDGVFEVLSTNGDTHLAGRLGPAPAGLPGR